MSGGGYSDSSNYVLSEESIISASGLFETQSFPIYFPFADAELNSMKEHILFSSGGSLMLYFSSVFDKSHLQTSFWFKPLNQM